MLIELLDFYFDHFSGAFLLNLAIIRIIGAITTQIDT
jgi:hypothetical protein